MARLHKNIRQLKKALSMESGGGAEETLQQTIANEVIPLIRQKNFIRQIAEKAGMAITMTKPSIKVPKMNKARGAYLVSPGQPAPEFKARLDGVNLVPRKIMSWLPIEQEVFEDSTIRDMEGLLKDEMANEFAQAEEMGFLFGDTAAAWDPGDVRAGFDGLFKQAAPAAAYTYDTNLDQTGADPNNVVYSNLVRGITNLGIYGQDLRNVIIFMGQRAGSALIRSRAFQTVSAYAYGSGAGIFTGEIGRVAGATVITSTFLDAPPGVLNSRCLVMEQSAFTIGDWQRFDIKLYNEILSQTDEIAIRARERVAMTVRYPEALVEILNFPANP